jgi:glutamate/tyrosine decarboxylase-like PLP-dependent enzyme
MRNKKSSEIAALIKDETFDMDAEKIRQLGYNSVDLIVDYFKNLSKGPILASNNFEQIKDLIIEPIPEGEKNPIDVINECKKKIINNSIRLGHPRLLGWIVTSGTIIGAFADGIASAINQNVAISRVGMATSIELLVIEWIKEILDYDSNAAGILLSGGSMANFTALAVARNTKADFNIKKQGLNQNNKNMVLYASEEVHMCIPKSANVLGIGENNIRKVKVNQNYCIDLDDLRAKIIEDHNSHKYPFAVVATAGTVNTGTIDPLDDIADICHDFNLWFHVDAAYGGFAAISKNVKGRLKGLNRADSIALDPHKWLFIPYEAGCVLVRNPAYIRDTFFMDAAYINTGSHQSLSNEYVDFSNYSIQLSRQFRALKIWMSLKQYGIKKYERIINQNIHLARYLEALVDESPDFQAITPANLSIFCFRYFPMDLKQKYEIMDKYKQKQISEYLNQLNQSIIEKTFEDQRIVISSTVLNEIFVLRVCIVNYRTTKQDIKNIISILRELGHAVDKKLRKDNL